MQPVPESPRGIEHLAAVEHDQWMGWSRDLAKKETLSPERLARWETLWVPYADLSEEQKEQDRVYARRVLQCVEWEDLPDEMQKALMDMCDGCAHVDPDDKTAGEFCYARQIPIYSLKPLEVAFCQHHRPRDPDGDGDLY